MNYNNHNNENFMKLSGLKSEAYANMNHSDMLQEMSIKEMMNDNTKIPTMMLPNPGEGGGVSTPNIETGIPMIPLPNPGEGGAVATPNIGTGIPTIPLPNPGEGGPISPAIPPTGGNILPTIISTIISSYPRPNETCKFCPPNSLKYGEVRVVNASCGYQSFQVYVNDKLFSTFLGTGEVTEYEKVEPGNQTFSLIGDNGYVYLQKPIDIVRNEVITIAIMETVSGIDLFVVEDIGGTQNRQRGSIRVCNLSYNSDPLSIIFGERYVSFYQVEYKEITDFKNIWAGKYDYYVTKSMIQPRQNLNDSNVLISSRISIESNVAYTMYIFNWKREEDAIRAVIIADY